MSAPARAGTAPLGAAALCVPVLLLALISGCGDGDSTTTSAATTGSTASGESKGGEYKGGEASIEEFGEEAGGTDRAAILAAFKGQLAAIGRKDFAATCSHLSKQAQEGLAELGKSVGKGGSCKATLEVTTSPAAPKVARQQAGGTVTKVRVEGNRAFVVFHAPGAKLYMETFVREDGEWRSTTAFASVLVPEL